MIEVASRQRNQPAPPHVVREALLDPNGGTGRAWLSLEAGEVRPQVIDDDLVWSSIWIAHPSARIRFDLPSDGSSGTDLRWTLLMDEPLPTPDEIAALRHRLNFLINGELRYSFGN